MLSFSQRLGATLLSLLLLAPVLLGQPLDMPLPAGPTLQIEALLGARQPCTAGTAAGFACRDIDLMSFLPVADLGGITDVGAASQAILNDIWGWTDGQTGREYAVVGRTDGTAFVDVTDAENPAFLGFLPRTPGTEPISWRDVKVYANHAFIVSEAPGHGVQVFDLTGLRGLTASSTRLFEQTARYGGVSSAHNIVVNEETGFAYAVGSRSTTGGPNCGRGLHMIDIRTPTNPTYAGCFADTGTGRAGTGYTHDAQCVVYRGPDTRYVGRELCFAANETALSIADVTDKSSPQKVSSASYPGVAYAHQGWLSEDQRYFFLDDELDESNGLVNRTRTLVFDLLELDSPILLNQHFGTVNTIDHNQYVVERYTFQANYTSGLRILDISDPAQLTEVAYFDTYPQADSPTSFLGLWSVYPFFASRNVVVSDRTGGLFVLRPTQLVLDTTSELPPTRFALHLQSRVVQGLSALVLDLPEASTVRVAVYDIAGRQVGVLADAAFGPGTHTVAFDPAGLASGTYFVRASSGADAQTRMVTVIR